MQQSRIARKGTPMGKQIDRTTTWIEPGGLVEDTHDANEQLEGND